MTTPQSPFSPLVYLKKELNFKFDEWAKLTEEEKSTLKKWAEAERQLQPST